MARAKWICVSVYILLPALLTISMWLADPVKVRDEMLVSMALGSVAYTILCVQLVLTARLKWLDRLFGLDRLIYFHGIAAMVAILLTIAHKLLARPGMFRYRPTHWADMSFTLFVIAAVFALFFLTDFLTGRISWLGNLKRKLYRFHFTRYHVQLALHHLNAVAVVVMFIHVVTKAPMRAALTETLLTICFAVAMGCYLWHMFLRSPRRMTVGQVIQENEQMTTLALRPEKGNVFSFRPGQFAFFRIYDPAVSSESHPFSISSAPENKETLAVTIKQLGDWTSKVKNIHPGSLVKVDGPYGRFSPTFLAGRPPLVLIAGGVGITPMMGIVSHYAHTDPEREILLIWCAGTQKELIHREEWETYEKNMPRFTWFPILSRDPDSLCEKGRISKELVEKALQKAGIDLAEAQFYFCGPAPMMQTVRGILRMMDVPSDRMHSERFSM